MSVRALSWVWSQNIKPATSKITLLAIADFANDQDCMAWPCMKTVIEMTSLDDRTVTKAIRDLIAQGYLVDSGVRYGKTGQVKAYRLNGMPSSLVHYVYQVAVAEGDGEYYIGVRSCEGNPETDPYTGSGTWPNKMRKQKIQLKKTILATFTTRYDAEQYEVEAVRRVWGDPKLMNSQMPVPQTPANYVQRPPNMEVFKTPKYGELNGSKTPIFVPKDPHICTQRPPNMGDVTIKEPLVTKKQTEPSPVKAFIDGWYQAFDEVFGERYVVEGAKDATGAKRLLTSTGQTPAELIDIARLAWKNRANPKCFRCKLASSIASFASQFNAIRIELGDIKAIQNKTETTKANEFDAIISNK